MSFWNVTYKDKDGQQTTMPIEAPSRADVFVELQKRGISAIRVEEAKGKAKPRRVTANRPAKASDRSGALVRGALAAVVVVAIASVAGYFMFSAKDSEDSHDGVVKAGLIGEATPAISPAAEPQSDEPKSAKDIAAEFSEQAKEFVKKAVTNETQWIVPPLDPDDPDNALRTRVCQELGSLLSIEPGEPMPPFPYSFLLEDDMRAAQERGEDVGEIDNGNNAFLDSLAKYRIAAKETDDEHRLEHKEKLLTAQGELLDAIDEGLSVNDTIRAAYEFRKRAYETRTELSNLLREIASEEGTDIESFKKQLEYANDKLKEEGILTIPIEEILPDYEEEEEAAPDESGDADPASDI